MDIKYILFLLLFPLVSVSQTASNGVIDLSEIPFAEGEKRLLNGEWRFAWNQFVDPSLALEVYPSNIEVPGDWFSHNPIDETNLKAFGFGSYALRIKLPRPNQTYALKLLNIHSSYVLFSNGKEIERCGVVSEGTDESVPSAQTKVVSFSSDSSGFAMLVLHVSNYDYPSAAGIWQPIEIGSYQTITASRSSNYLLTGFLIGSLIVMALYHIGLFLSRRKDYSTLVFAIMCFILALRETFSGEVIVFDFLPNLHWHVATRMIMGIFSIVTFAFSVFLYLLYPRQMHKKFVYVVLAVTSIFLIIVLATPSTFYLNCLIYLFAASMIFGVYYVYVLIRAVIAQEEGALLFMIGTVVMLAAVVHDIMLQTGKLTGTFLVPAAFFVFVLMQSLVLAVRFTRSFFRVEELLLSLDSTNKAYERFVPKELLQLLNKRDIVSVKLGEELHAEMTVLFADIVGFTTIAERIDDKATFEFLNWTLGQTSPIIKNNNGFIDKYIGDAIMAVFPDKPDDAIIAGIEMRQQLHQGMENNPFGIDVNADYGVGIHTGDLILGTVGGQDRMEGTVISDAVNTAARVEGLTRKYKVGVIVTQDVVNKLHNKELFEFRLLDEASLKGKTKKVTIYEVTLR